MSITGSILLGVIIALIIYILKGTYKKVKPKKEYEHQELIDNIHARIAKANGATIEQFSLGNSIEAERIKKDKLYKNADFINKDCTSLEAFIINDDINGFDLRKLADLNQIELQISDAWYPLTVELIKELHRNGWNKRVSCIKEKFARLTVYIRDNTQENGRLQEIIEKYARKSTSTCETCGENGEIRYNTRWDYVACRKHYLENRGTIKIESSGFNHNGTFYAWKAIIKASFEDLNHNERYEFLKLELKTPKVKHQGWTDNIVYVSENTIGFGNFLNHLPQNFPSLNLNYLEQFKNPDYCEVCGYKAVYFEICECCEHKIWEKLNTWEKDLKQYQANKNRHIERIGEEKYNKRVAFYQERISKKEELKMKDITRSQILWTIDEGEIYESRQNNYPKNPEYDILFTNEELEKYL